MWVLIRANEHTLFFLMEQRSQCCQEMLFLSKENQQHLQPSKLDSINIWEFKLEDLQHKLSSEEKQEFAKGTTLDESQHKDLIMNDEHL